MNKVLVVLIVLVAISLAIFFLRHVFTFIISLISNFRSNLKKKKEEKKEKQKQKDREVFKRLFNFYPEDENLSGIEKAKYVNDVLKLFALNFFKVGNNQTEIFNYVSVLIKKDFFDTTIIEKIALKKFFILYPVNWGLGFSSLDHLRIFINLIVAQKKNLFWEAHRVAKIFGYYVHESIKPYYF
ncbi:hypothetical protein COU48_01370 [Candidatus Nomurabacteria bacterium CG10_big_fil_rev_8_21_14_0_10_03_31_7]|uniref:Uncharacterized protein n=1 Tax=Candidatus Nomurabacteria bacterium CG10_big_fil_rev_8_21_14_0_10_03_31_7 TaxID=1974730 RepID=A0A2J0JHY7_9BACT|nr:MAG: hypothetical protein COU48_01370 [Candidatus Nomurabacteria bacterium CG10_big_fil_rev_8_21_14_0_10_03_31_7]